MSKAKQPFIDVSGLCKIFGVKPIDEYMLDLRDSDLYGQALADGATDEEAMKAEQAESDEAYNHYYDAVMGVAEELFTKHGLVLEPRGKYAKITRPYEFRIAPEHSWDHAAARIMTTSNGVGMFHFSSLKEFLSSGPYTAREAVLTHLGIIAYWPEVYEGRMARTMVDRRLR